MSAALHRPLQNRVDPFGALIADPARGTLMGNRGGRFHRDDRTLGARRYASRQWICCVLEFKKRHRKVWGDGYTELFFLDEVTALAAGHRPCFECRRVEAQSFAAAFAAGQGRTQPLRAPEMDRLLQAERLDGRAKRTYRAGIGELPDGTMIAMSGVPHALRGPRLLRWTPTGYAAPQARPRTATAEVLTPPSIVTALAAGYAPRWHPSAGA